MEQDNTAIGLGIPYLILIFLTWVNSFSYGDYYSYYPWIYEHWGGLLALIGCLMLIPVFILTIIFITGHSNTSEEAAFGFAMPAWFLIIIGSIVGLYYTVSSYVIPTMFIVYVCPQIILGFGLFARRSFGQTRITQTLPPNIPPNVRRPAPGYIRRSVPNRPVPTRQGSVTIPNEVRMASTIGQDVKRCVRCSQTIDQKTQVCYFCGAQQPPRIARSPPPVSTPTIRPSPSPRPHTPQSPYGEGFKFCPNCGTQVDRGHLFCTQCGSSLE